MKDVRNDELVRLSFKPALTREDETTLERIFSADPSARAAWEEDRALSRAVQSLPNVPLSGNFTARVLQAIDLEEAREARENSPRGNWLKIFWPRLVGGGAALLLALFGLHELRVSKQMRVVKEVAFVSEDSGNLPSADVLRDFDAIEQMRTASDVELLTALQ